MIVFIDDRPIRITGPKAAALLESSTDYDHIIDARLEALRPDSLLGHVLILNATPIMVEKLIQLLNSTKLLDLHSVTLVAVDKKAAEERLKSLFKIVKAAGGVVFKGEKMLLMFRRGKWDLPKGKLDEGEKSRMAAEREVEEETGVKVSVEERVCTTWHTYTMNGSRVLKRTKWYLMTCRDESHMMPQAEEDIERLEWVDRREAQRLLTNSFSSIRFVIDAVYEGEKEV
ncbi:NUDIX hydrolase [Tellurirhabdus bombi]|uniref:NUDIX hydrolase n=1 Tax=Tellurirhabdus bombi TaxID=2907205 RepID=UPI001F244C69|nr:NUDIX domain-containing protein [Tellurirhabdus bombi]